MKILEFGKENEKKIILIHGFQCPYQVWNKYIDRFKENFHIIIPILPGHYPNDDNFVSVESTAKEIEDFYLNRYGNNVYAIYGMSLGGVIVAKIWQNKRIKIDNIIFDGSPLVSQNKLMNKLLTWWYLNISKKTRLRDRRVIDQAKKTIVRKENFNDFLKLMDHMTNSTVTNVMQGVGNYLLPININTNETNIYYYHGTKINEFYSKKSAKYLLEHYPHAKVHSFKGKGHCEISIMEYPVMINELNKILYK